MLHRCHSPGPAAPLVILPHYDGNLGGGGEGETARLYFLNLTVALKEGLSEVCVMENLVPSWSSVIHFMHLM